MSLTMVRELGAFERFRSVLHDLRLHRNVTVMARLTGNTIDVDDLEVLTYNALQQAILQHPALRVAIVHEGANHESRSFVHLSPIDLRKMVTMVSSTLVEPDPRNTDETLGRYSSADCFPEVLPPWKLVVTRYANKTDACILDMAFVWHHAIGDGKSGLAALATIIEGLNHSSGRITLSRSSPTKNDALYMVYTNDAPLNLPLEDLMQMPTSWPAYMRSLGKRLGQYWPYAYPDSKWAGAPYSFIEPITTGTRTVRISTAETRALLLRCHEEKVTLTPLIQTLVGKVILEAIPTASWLRGAIAISLRRFFPSSQQVADNEMGLYVSAFYIDVNRTDFCESRTMFWNLVRKNADLFRHEIAKGDMDIETGLLRSMNNFTATLTVKQDEAREKSYGITNLGLFKPGSSGSSLTPDQKQRQESDKILSQDSRWKLNEVLFTQSCHANGSAIQFCIISTQNGPLNIALSWQNGIVSNDIIDRVAADLLDQLLAISSDANQHL